MDRKRAAWLLWLILAQSSLVEAQVALPGVRLPTLPGGGLPFDADRSLTGLTGDLDPRRLENLRALRILDLVRTHPREIETDSHGAAVLRGEVVVFAPSDIALDKARAAGFVVLREHVLQALDSRVVVLKAPDGMATRRAVRELQRLDASGVYDFNHLYTDSGVVAGAGPVAATGTGNVTTKVGLIDGGVDIRHAVFRELVIHQHGCAGTAEAAAAGTPPPAAQGGALAAETGVSVPTAHGTAVASLLVGRSAGFQGAAPGSELYAADVYCGRATGGAVDAVVEALGWLAHERVPVINVSLVGPANATLENIVRLMVARGHLIVAAVGNDGPAAPPLYPASYPDVVGVTGVDAHQHALLEACRGKQVKFSAPGADISAANASQAFAAVRGTSFAAPIVAGLLAESLRAPDRAAAERAVAELAAHAIDLGAPGVDPVYGAGLVGAGVPGGGSVATGR